jgi:hypothetical protein
MSRNRSPARQKKRRATRWRRRVGRRRSKQGGVTGKIKRVSGRGSGA